MTREEIVNSMSLQDAIQVLKDTNCYGTMDIAKTVILKALEQEPCEDCISREDALMALTGEWTDSTDELIHRFIKRIRTLPPVKPTEKVGRWKRISMDKYVQHAMAYYKCSVCGEDIIGTHNYCPSCGSRMMQEVEDEN